tara:strand:- start:4763 stop:5899 length:1137 start_codon:yes stop_codon:yes gene_type:complete
MGFNYLDNHHITGEKTQSRTKGFSGLDSNRIDGTPQVSIHIEAPTTLGKDPGTMTVTNNPAFGPTLLTGTFAGYYSFVIPNGGVYILYACGASGGDITTGSYAGQDKMGYGYQKCIEYTFDGGETIYMMAGQRGDASSDNQGMGGGGMAAIGLSTGADPSSSTPLVVGGGGGGDHRNYNSAYGSNIEWASANDGEKGHNGGGAVQNLNGSTSYAENDVTTVGEGTALNTNTYYVNQGSNRLHRFASWHGGGYNSSGGGTSVRSGGSAGAGFKQGGVGGTGTGTAGEGGWGGGGSSSTSCGYGGGGGGYTGGMSGGYINGCGGVGGGGGSYAHADGTAVATYTGRPGTHQPGAVGIIHKNIYLTGSGTYPNSNLPRTLS